MTRQITIPNVNRWQQSLAEAVTDPAELLSLLNLTPDIIGLENDSSSFNKMLQRFPLKVPKGFIARMRKGDPNDPLLRQILPIGAELKEDVDFSYDPLGERQAAPVPGLLHKYTGRVLLLVVGACGVHCRYCFRRYFPYSDNALSESNLDQALSYIAKDTSIKEVIFSGGDPLSASDNRLRALAERVAAIPHVRRLRIHSRMPIVLPERITQELISWLTETRLKTVVVVHTNHANEIDETVKAGIKKLITANIILLNQSVLLRGVNDSVLALSALSEQLFEMGILPYYLHMLDKVQGASHFAVDEAEAQKIMWELMQQLPGYLIPRLVKEQSDAPAKLPISLAQVV